MNIEKPDIVIFMTDHQRWDTIFPYCRAPMPNLEKLAEESAVFTNAYCTATHCCPARASFWTGLYPSMHGVWNNVDGGSALRTNFFENVHPFSERLNESGYNCLISGKWHISAQKSPFDCGFTDGFHKKKYLTKPDIPNLKEWYTYKNYWGEHVEHICTEETVRNEGEIVRIGYPLHRQYYTDDHPHNDDKVAENALRLYDTYTSKLEPMFLFVGVGGPHDPYMAPQEYIDAININSVKLPKSYYDALNDKPNLYRKKQMIYHQMNEGEVKETIRHYLALCSYEDYLAGQLIEKVKRSGRDTVFLYLSDHGDYMGEHGLFAKGLPCFDGAYHIPLLIYDSRIRKGILNEQLVSICDVSSTILDYAGLPYERNISLRPLVEGKNIPMHEYLYTQTNGNELYGMQRSIRSLRYKLIVNGFDFDEFYDLQNDPDEMHNLIDREEYAEEIKQLYYKLWEFSYENMDGCVCPYILVGLEKYGPGIIFEKEHKKHE